MKYCKILIIALLSFALEGQALAFLDFGQEILEIPDTHEGKKYEWPVRDNPPGFMGVLEQQTSGQGEWLVTLRIPSGEKITEVHLFLVDPKFKNFRHIIPRKQNNLHYKFSLGQDLKGKFQVEIVAKTDRDWLRLSSEITAMPQRFKAATHAEDGLSLIIKTIPAKVYADHVVTFVFEIQKDGIPVKNLEQTAGFEMHLAAWRTSWFTKFGEFVYGRNRQNLGGPEVAVSIVPKETGHYKIFGQYKFAGEVHTVATDLQVYYEPKPNAGGIQNLMPAED